MQEYQYGEKYYKGAYAGDHVPEVPAHAGVVGVLTSWHTIHAYEVHWEEGDIESNKCQPEIELTQAFTHQSPSGLGEPIVDSGEDSKDTAPKKDIV